MKKTIAILSFLFLSATAFCQIDLLGFDTTAAHRGGKIHTITPTYLLHPLYPVAYNIIGVDTTNFGNIHGTGTSGYLSKWTGTFAGSSMETQGNSIVFNTGTRIGIGTATPQAILDIQGATLDTSYSYGVNNRSLVTSLTQATYGFENNPYMTPADTKAALAFAFDGTIVGTAGQHKTGYMAYISTMTKVGTFTVDNAYGLYINNPTIGTNNYPLYIPSGVAYFGGTIGLGVTAPTALIHLKAGTATAGTAPLKFTQQGVMLSTTEAGAVEYNGSHLYFTAADAGTRYQLDQQSDALKVSISDTAGMLTPYLRKIDSTIAGRVTANTSAITANTTSLALKSNIVTPTFTTNITTPIIYGSAASAGTLALGSTSHATKGKILFGTSAYDEANNWMGIGTASPTAPLHLASTIAGNSELLIAGTVSSTTTIFGAQFTTAISSSTNHVYGWYSSPTLTPPTGKVAVNFATQGTVVAGTGLTIPFSNQIDVAGMTKSGSGTVTTSTGIYLRDQTAGTNNYGVYQDGSNYNYFNGKIGIATLIPTARLHLPAGTATANTSPLKLTSGTVLTTPEAGSVEFDGTNYFTTIGTTRYILVRTLTGTAAPATTPAAVGIQFVDTTNKKVYVATGTASSADWTILN